MENPWVFVFFHISYLHYNTVKLQQIELFFIQITNYFRVFIKKINVVFLFLHYNIMIFRDFSKKKPENKTMSRRLLQQFVW